MGNGVFFFYPKVDNENKPKKQWRNRCVIAAIVDDVNHTLSYGVSMCSTKDAFCKKEGRVKALGRAKYHIPMWKKMLDDRAITTQFVEHAKLLESILTSQLIGENIKQNKTSKLEIA